MALFWKAAAGVMISVVLVLVIEKNEKDLALLLTMAAFIMTVIAAFALLEPVVGFLKQLEELSNMKSDILGTLLKVVGIGLITEIAAVICQDSGKSSLARGMQLLGSALILSLSIPVFETLLELIQTILGEL